MPRSSAVVTDDFLGGDVESIDECDRNIVPIDVSIGDERGVKAVSCILDSSSSGRCDRA